MTLKISYTNTIFEGLSNGVFTFVFGYIISKILKFKSKFLLLIC
jgi:hypothetical protein